jgi:hypothetical protein
MVPIEISDELCSDQDAFSGEPQGKRSISANIIRVVFYRISEKISSVFSNDK